ncbi:hypothetical protein [Actinomadura sp. DC4]|uniref:hypothetical protein n=1 Tax=Actinomadura sp. DC4 TaxID=3055069 RepID=UPI0025B194A7|nr:hypothetical protein [Actinomadura sp. DC4]MDN3356393.1 hypothetical protein [Actinomadura sp. DC4]
MTAPVARPRTHRRRWILALASVLMVAIGAVVTVMVQSVPDYRIAFLVDASATESPGAVADAVGAAVRNTGDGDALSLRRFGGRCGDPRNTAQVVGTGTGHAARVSASAHRLTPTGVATLESGVLAAIHDFAGRYPYRGRRSNRIIVVTGRGADACTRDQTAMKRAVQAKVDAAGLRLDFRFVGYLTPAGEQGDLTQLASAAKAPAPDFARTPAELAATLKRLVIPNPREAVPVKVPTPTPAPLADGSHYAYVKSVDATARVVTIDPIQYLTGEAGQSAAREDGEYFDDDYYIRNRDKKTVELQVATGSRITCNILAGIISSTENVTVSLDRLARLVKASPEDAAHRPFTVIVTRGQVSRLREMWTP